jgi:hypothetical protein
VPLSPLQQRVAAIVAETTEGHEVGLAGGAALIVSGIGDRITGDLDFFATTAATVDELAPRVLDALRSAGLVVEQIRLSPGFTRLQIADRADTTELDLAWDARIRNLRDSEYGPVLDRDELAADKMLALYGRAEARDSSTSTGSAPSTREHASSSSRPRRIAGSSPTRSPKRSRASVDATAWSSSATTRRSARSKPSSPTGTPTSRTRYQTSIPIPPWRAAAGAAWISACSSSIAVRTCSRSRASQIGTYATRLRSSAARYWDIV